MKAIFKPVVAGAMLAAGLCIAGAAGASTVVITAGNGVFGRAHAAGSYMDDYTFTIAPSTNEWVTVSAALGQTYTGSTHTANFNISDLTFYQINGNNSHTTLPSTSNNSAGLLYYPTAALAPGLYGFTVAGNTVGGKGGSYSGTLSLTPVPEPAGYALLTVGLGILGLTARRQRNDKLG